MMAEQHYRYDVGLSFAGEQREYVEEVANELTSRGIRTFYDDYEKGTLWGKDLYAHLSEVYQHYCRYCVIFGSKEYATKVWPSLERERAQARALQDRDEYILPARFDDTPIPGLPDTVRYIDLNDVSPIELVGLIVEKIGEELRYQYLPPSLDRLYECLDIGDDSELQGIAFLHAHSFLGVLGRMSPDERDAVITAIRFGCPAEMPENVHINTDLLRRSTGKTEASLARLLGGVNSLGFSCYTREDTTHETNVLGIELQGSHFFCLSWVNLRSFRGERDGLSALRVAQTMVLVATENYCEEHGTEFLKRLDFSQLARATATRELHQADENH